MTTSVRPEDGPGATTERAYPCLDGLRLLAATAIIVVHSAYSTGQIRETGLGRTLARLEIGVPVFFVLSGFLLSRPFLLAAARGTARPRSAAYLWRRALRILPAYWVMVATALLVVPGNAGARTGTWLRYLTMTQLYTPGPTADALSHTWSLCTEVAFYLFLPLVGAGLARLVRARPDRPRAAMGVLGAGGLIGVAWTWWFAGVGPLPVQVPQWLPGYAAWFGIGMALSLLTVADPAWQPVRVARELAASLPTCWAGAAVVFWIATGTVAGPASLSSPITRAEYATRHVLYAVVAALVVLPLVFGDQHHGTVRRVLRAPSVRFLGLISYGIFLFHRVVLDGAYEWSWFGLRLFSGNLVLVSALTWVGSVALAWASYVLLEDPLSRFRGLVPEYRARHSASTTRTTTASTAASTSA